MVPGGSDGNGNGNGNGNGKGKGSGNGSGRGRMAFPSRRKQFLGFVALSEWLLQQLGGGGGLEGAGSVPTTMAVVSPSPDAPTPTTVCANILRGCQVSFRWPFDLILGGLVEQLVG